MVNVPAEHAGKRNGRSVKNLSSQNFSHIDQRGTNFCGRGENDGEVVVYYQELGVAGRINNKHVTIRVVRKISQI